MAKPPYTIEKSENEGYWSARIEYEYSTSLLGIYAKSKSDATAAVEREIAEELKKVNNS